METTFDNKDEFVWTKDKLLHFIKLYKSNPCLYVVSLAEYKNKNKREAAYRNICSTFNNERACNLTVAMVKKKIHCIKTQYQKEVNKIKSSKTNGAGTDDIYVPKLWYFPLLEFLCDKNYPVRYSISNLEVINHHENSDLETNNIISTEENEDLFIFNEAEDINMLSPDDIHSVGSSNHNENKNPKKRKRQSSNLERSNDPMKELLLQANNTKTTTSKSICSPPVQDGLTSFAQTLVIEMKLIKNKRNLQKLKRKILNCVFDCQDEDTDE